MSISLTDEQREAVENRGGGLLVSAAAGSGKTRVLVERLLRRVTEDGEDLDHFLIITYTKAAAAELRGKIIDALNEQLAQTPGDRHLRRQTTLIYRTQISTIHSFCQMVLKEEGYQIDLDPDFRVADENACAILKKRVLDRLMERHYETVTDGDDFSHLLDTMAAGRDDRRLTDMVLDIHAKVQSHPDPHAWLEEQCSRFALEGVTDVGQTAWGQLLLQDSLDQAQYWQGQMVGLLDQLDGTGALEAAYAPVICALLDSLDDFIAALRAGWDKACQRCQLNYGRLKGVRNPDDPALAERVKALKKACKDQMDKVTGRFARSSEALLEDLRAAAPAVTALLRLVEEFDEAFAAEKRRQKQVDFSDLEHLALRLLVDSQGQPTQAALRLERRYVEVMVDEYQDTNQVQNVIFNAVSHNGDKLFLVGDVKQSIYRFRLADPTIFLDRFERFPYFYEAEEGQPRKVVLSKNFRSRTSVLDAANFVFRCLMSRSFGEIDYTADHYLNPGLEYPDYAGDRPELDVVDLANLETPEDEADSTTAQVEADFVARRIRRLMEDEYQVTDGNRLRPVEWSDIVILYRSPGSVLSELTKALDSQRVPWQADGGEDFFATTEISVALSYLQIIDNPHQDVPLISVLRSPLYGFTPDQLADIRAGCRDADFYTALVQRGEEGDGACQDFLQQLADLRFCAADRTAAGLLWELYEQTGMLPIFSALEGGEIRRNNLILLYEYARQFEKNGYRGLFDFVTQLRRMTEAGRGITVTGAQGSGVRIMSIHKSKGLEFPVVVLAGLARRFNRTDERAPMLFHAKLGVGPKGLDVERGVEFSTLARTAVALQLERELCAEELRLLYVAMTRAREKLILVCTLRNARSTLEKRRLNASFPMEPQALMAMNSMGDWVLSAAMTRWEGACLCLDGEPLNHYNGNDTPWSIHLLDGCRPERYFRRKKPTEQGAEPGEDALEHLYWSYPHSALADIPSKLTATQLKGRFRDEETAEDAAPAPRPVTFRRPEFTQTETLTPAERGTALHLFLQLCDPEKAATYQGAREELARLQASGCMTEAQARACSVKKVTEFFRSDLGRQARALGMEREFKFSILSDAAQYYGPDGAGEQVLLQGVVDLWFRTLEGITVVDFKTDHIAPGEEPVRAEQYRQQMEAYTAALEKITGVPVAHRYLWFFQTGGPFEL